MGIFPMAVRELHLHSSYGYVWAVLISHEKWWLSTAMFNFEKVFWKYVYCDWLCWYTILFFLLILSYIVFIMLVNYLLLYTVYYSIIYLNDTTLVTHSVINTWWTMVISMEYDGLQYSPNIANILGTWWLLPLTKWVITPVVNGISRVNTLVTRVS